MTLNQLYNEQFSKEKIIGVYEEKNGKPSVYQEYADELLETHGDKEINDYQYSAKHKLLVVEFKK